MLRRNLTDASTNPIESNVPDSARPPIAKPQAIIVPSGGFRKNKSFGEYRESICHAMQPVTVPVPYLPNSIESLEARSFHINPAGYISELGTSVGTTALSRLNFVQIRHCNGGMSP